MTSTGNLARRFTGSQSDLTIRREFETSVQWLCGSLPRVIQPSKLPIARHTHAANGKVRPPSVDLLDGQ